MVLLAFLRLTTRAGLFRQPLGVQTALDLVDAWLQQPWVIVPEPTAHHLRTLRDLILPLGTGGNLTSDAHLAALAIEHGAELCSADGDFARFTGLQWRNPLAGQSAVNLQLEEAVNRSGSPPWTNFELSTT